MSPAGKVFAVAVLAALAWAVAPVAEAQPPIRIGATLAQRGLGQSQFRGYQLCVKHVNDKGGVLGRKLALVVYDDGSDPATAVRLYEKLIIQDKVDLVLAPYSSLVTDAVADVTEKNKMPMVAPGAAATSIYRYLQEGAEVHLLIALPAWRIGAAVVTAHSGEFARIAEHLPGLVVAAPTEEP